MTVVHRGRSAVEKDSVESNFVVLMLMSGNH